jgi:hypothetical protein
MSLKRVWMTVAGVLLVAALGALSGCGDSGSNDSAARLEAAKHEGEEVAREKARIDRLEQKVRHLQSQTHSSGSGSTVVVEHDATVEDDPSQTGGSEVLRSFHAPSGNVSCEILSDGALCSVDSIDETFSFSDGGEGSVATGVALPRGAGESVGYGESVAAGSVICTIPPSDSPHGIVCADSDSGHGFEASRVLARQRTY